MPRLFWKTFYWCHKVLPNRTILGIIAILIFFNISMVVYHPRSEVLEVITQGPKTKPILEHQAPITYASSKQSSSTRRASSLTKKSDYHPGEDQWHTFNISGIKLHVYSAYYDDRNKGEEVIRMNGAIKGVATGFTQKTNCLIETKHKGHFVKTIVRVEYLKEHFRLPWISSFIFCKLSEQDKAQASDFLRVSLVQSNETSMSSNSMQIHRFPLKNDQTKEVSLAVCVKPFHFQFNRALWLIEFIEMYRVQGAQHFIFYNHTLGPDVEKAISYYIKLGIVSLQQWNLPLRSQKDIRTEAMFTAINDCNLRAVNRFDLLAMVDIDEFIMPLKAPNLTALLQPYLPKKFGSFNFRNVFHYLYWENNTDTMKKFYAKNQSLPYLLTQMKLRRVVVSQNHGTRSKYIVRPNYVTNAGNHQVWKYVKGTIPPPDHVVVLQALPPYSTKYKDTNDYYWPLISTKDDTAYVNAEKKALAVPDTRGPFGFGDAVQLKDDKCIVKSNFGKKGDRCILHPKDCHRGISFSIWEKVSYKEDVLNVDKDHDKRYVFSTGGDFDEEKGLLYPGMAIYHQGMDLIAVVATDNDVWQLNVRGQLVNETWSNIGIRWEPNPSNPNLPLSEQGGLELYVNAEKIGHAIKPLKKPLRPPPEVENKWIERPLLEPDWRKPSWNKIAEEAPIMMIGCHRNSDDENYRDFCREDTAFDELAIWTRKLNVNRTHNEVLYFTAGYDPQFEGLTLDKWAEMLDRVELHDPGQMEIAGIVSAQFSQQAKELANVISPLTSSIDESDNVQVVTDLESSSAGKSDKIYPRTDQEQEDFDRAQLSYESAKKLLNFDGLRTIERPRYLVKRWSVVPTASISLEDEHENIHGWESVVLDPDQEGASQLVKRIERYSMYYMNSADLREGENFDGFYDASKPMMMVHAHSSAITMTVAKLTMQGLKSFGGRIDVKKMASQNTVNNFTEWDNHNEYLEIPSTIMFKNESLCGNKSFTLLTAIYNGYGKMGPLRRNPQSLRAKEIKLDSKAISVQLMVSPNPDRLDEDLSSCQLDHEKMRYHPVTIRFYHYDKQTSLRKLLWHEDDLDTNIEVRKCAVYNDDIGRYGAWDADKCTTVLSEQHSTVCECYTTGTFILIAEMVEPPAYGPEYDWLWIVKYVGYGLSIVLLLVFITVIFINPFLWEMFHVLRGITGFCYCVALICMFVAENEGIRKDRHDNIAISVFQQYWFLATCVSLLAESFATFRAITGGIIGGKTLGYIPMIFGLPMIDIGVTMFLYGDDYGRDPRAFIGWANDTKLVFFYAIFAAAGLAVLLCFVIIFNISTPQTRKDSVVEQLSSQGTGLTVMVMIFAMTWGFAFPAYIRFPDRETPDFFPIFQVLNAWSGVFVMAFLGMSSSRFRAGLLGNGSLKGSPLFKYMVSSKRRKRHAMAFGAFFGGDGNLSGLSSRAMSSESLPSGPDSLDEDIEAGNNDEDYDSADSLDNDDVDSSNDEKKVKEESSSSDSEGDESDSGSGKDV